MSSSPPIQHAGTGSKPPSPRLWHAVAGCVLLLISVDARAHVVNPTLGGFMTGLIHPLSAAEHLLPMLALGLMAAQQRQLKAERVTGVFLGALAAGAVTALVIGPSFITYANVLNVASMIIIGILIAAAPPLPSSACYALSLLFGISHGFGNSVTLINSANFHEFIPGLLTGAFLAILGGIVTAELVHRLHSTWPHIALRVAGSWIAAIGLLILGFMFRG